MGEVAKRELPKLLSEIVRRTSHSVSRYRCHGLDIYLVCLLLHSPEHEFPLRFTDCVG